MSISTPRGGGENRRPSVVSTGTPGRKATSAASKPAASRSTPAKPGSAKGGKGGGPRKPITPVKVSQGRNWGPIALLAAVILLAAGIIGYGAYYVYTGGQSWRDKAAAIDGVIDWGKRDPRTVESGHQDTGLEYIVNPPVGGKHNNAWQRCLGDVYDAPIASEHAVHSLEHGAVWITYRPDLPADQVEKLASRVRGQDYTLMSPFEGLDKPIALQAWGYQLKVDNADDKRIDEFISVLRNNAGLEKNTCSAGNFVTATGDEPRNMGQDGMGG